MASSSSSSTSHRLMPQAQPSGPPPLPHGTLPLLSSGLGGMAGASGTAGSTDSSKPESRLEHEFVRAVTANDVERVQELLDSDPQFAANINDRDGWSALHNCCSGGHLFGAKYLIEAGCNVSIQSNNGHTPLMIASGKGFVDLVELLLNNRADPTTVNKFGDTAYDLAAQAEEPYICEILQNSEQDVIERRNRASGNSQTRGPLMVQHNTVIELIHENQRCGFLSRQFSDTNLNKSDLRGPWSTALGRPCSLDDVQLPLVRDAQTGQLVRGWFWLSDWRVDTKHPRVDAVDGWQYAKTFDDPDMQWLAAPIGSVLNTWVRRRRWIRVRKRRADVRSEEQAKEEESSEAEANQDYLTVARNRIERMSAGEDNQNLNSVKAELDEYENSIKELLAGIKDDTDLIRKRAASALVSAYLEQAEERNALIDALEESDDAEEGEDKDQSQSQAHSKGKGPATIGRGT
ncbi:hypothetical protein DFJ77DRAFT_267138 [Powellomyces hirtus]|nr:hypothetical protein DFJ77DRAFT_267138 [Powellomyces hirtus]